MPLRCLDAAGNSIYSFDFSDDEWQALLLANRKSRHLRTPCCNSPLMLKRSPRGTPFFAHMKRGTCATAPETEEHLVLKRMVVEAARRQGWTANTEVTGITPAGEPWPADVLVQNDLRKVAVEIQWSGQTNEETWRRQERYKECGIRGLWLFRRAGFLVTHDLPAVCVGGNVDDGFTALVADHSQSQWRQGMPLGAFIDAVFDGRFRFGLPPRNIEATVTVLAAERTCWHDACQAKTRILSGIKIAFGPNNHRLSVSDVGEHSEPLCTLLKHIPRNLNIGEIKPRFSKTVGRAYVSNVCVRCDRLMGAFFEHDVLHVEEPLCHFAITLSEQWRQAILSRDGLDDWAKEWRVYPQTNSSSDETKSP
jgi:hypothetical protein